MIRQDDERFTSEWIKEKGCALMSVLYYVNKFKNVKMAPNKIEIYFEQMKDGGCFTDNLDIIWYKAFAFFGIDVRVIVKNDSKYKLKKNEYAIAEWYNERTGLYHFTPVEGSVCLYDPLGLSKTVAEGYVKSLRIIKVN